MKNDKDSKVVERGNWTGRLDFVLSCIGYAVGLGNIWRFPYLCFRNGGGAFLIPYTIMLFMAGLPLFYFELSLGQFASLGPITIWKIVPLFRGVGYAMVLMSAMVSVYYNIIIMWSIYYMFAAMVSLDDYLPWQTCDNPWNTKWCYSVNRTALSAMTESESVAEKMTRMNETCVTDKIEELGILPDNLTRSLLVNNMTNCSLGHLYQTPSSEYWHNHVLRIDEADGIGGLGPVSLKLAIFLFLAWVLVFFCLKKGIKTSGRVVYFTATFPYVVLIILLVRGVTLEGYYKGIEFYIFPEWSHLLRPSVWGDAAAQIFYSLGPAWGGLMTMASYNRFNNNAMRDAIIVSLVNCGTSVFAGFVIFSMLGFIATNLEIAVKDVAVSGQVHIIARGKPGRPGKPTLSDQLRTIKLIRKEVLIGPGLVFIVYPEGIAQMPVSALWAFLFFFMLLTLGLDSQFAMMETIISAISDIFPVFLRKHKSKFTLFCCFVGFLLGLPIVTTGGVYILTLMNDYSASYSLLVVGCLELIAVCWIYGFKKFCKDIEMMMGSPPNIYFLACWVVLTPIILVFIVVLSAIQTADSVYLDYVFEPWAQGIGWAMTAAPMIAIIVVGIIEIIKAKGIRKACRTHDDWGPALDENRTGRYKPLYANGYGNPSFTEMDDIKPEKYQISSHI